MADTLEETPNPSPEEPDDDLTAKQKESKGRQAIAEAEKAEAEAKKAGAEAEKAEAEAKKAGAEAEKAEAEAKQEKLKTQFPSGEAEPVEGKITIDDKAGYIATVAAYDALKPQAKQIAEEIKGRLGNNSRVLIVDSLDFASADIQLLQVRKQISFWRSEIDTQLNKILDFTREIDKMIKPPAPAKPKRMTILPEAVGTGLQAAKGVVSMLADIAGYFKIDYEVKGQTVDLAIVALQSLVAGLISSSKCSVLLSRFYHIGTSAVIKVLDDFNQCVTDKDQLRLAMTDLKESLASQAAVAKKNDGKKEEKELIDEAEKACENAGALIKEFGEFNKALTTVPADGGYSPLATAALREYIDAKGISHLLYLNIVSSGGTMVTGKGLFCWSSPGFLGSCVVTYVLAKCSGEVVASDTFLGSSGVKYHLLRNNLEIKNPAS